MSDWIFANDTAEARWDALTPSQEELQGLMRQPPFVGDDPGDNTWKGDLSDAGRESYRACSQIRRELVKSGSEVSATLTRIEAESKLDPVTAREVREGLLGYSWARTPEATLRRAQDARKGHRSGRPVTTRKATKAERVALGIDEWHGQPIGEARDTRWGRGHQGNSLADSLNPGIKSAIYKGRVRAKGNAKALEDWAKAGFASTFEADEAPIVQEAPITRGEDE